MPPESIWVWIGFGVIIVTLLLIDLAVFHRKAQVESIRAATVWTLAWISLALAFGTGLYVLRGTEPALEFLTGYLIEKSLSVDNIFVFTLIFASLRTPAIYQRVVLFWGILGALIFRAVLIVLGASLLERFEWILYVFGAFLVFTGLRLAREEKIEVHLERSLALRMIRRVVPITSEYVDGRFFVRRAGALVATPLFLVLVLIETSDLIFAVDSIPAIFAITQNAFIVYSSNVFAILGLRSLYFVLAGAVGKLAYLNEGLAAILVFVGIKMLVSGFFTIPTLVALGVIVIILMVTVVLSLSYARTCAKAE